MSYIPSVQNAIDYIESNLREDLTIEKVAIKANYSVYHFHRLFMAVMGCSIKTYIRRRRMTCAAYDLNQTKKRIIDIAYEYGFESQEAFTKSFQQVFGVTPGKYRKTKPYLDFVGPHELTALFPSEQDEFKLTPKIIQIEPFFVIGMEKNQLEIAGSAHRDQTIQMDIPALWETYLLNRNRIKEKVDKPIDYGIGRPTEGGVHFSYMACTEVASADTPVPPGMVGTLAPGGTYAAFHFTGPASTIPKFANFIYGTWLPQSSYQLNFGVELEIYDERWKEDLEEETSVEICVPIKKH